MVEYLILGVMIVALTVLPLVYLFLPDVYEYGSITLPGEIYVGDARRNVATGDVDIKLNGHEFTPTYFHSDYFVKNNL